MLKYLKKYPNPFVTQLNHDIMNKTYDNPLVDYIKDVWKSLEVCPAIKILKFEYNQKESEIDINRYIFKRDKRQKKKDRYDYKFINDSRCGSLTTHVQITLPVKDPKTGEVQIHKKIIKKNMLIPIQVDDGCFIIRGKKYYMIYQLVEKTTYTGNQKVTLKSLMPIEIKRKAEVSDGIDVYHKKIIEELASDDGAAMRSEIVKEDINSEEYVLPVYYITMFKKEIPTLLFFFANGVETSLNFLGVHDIIEFTETTSSDENTIYFPISSKLYIKVKNKELFMKYPYIKSIVGGILNITSNRMTLEDIMDTQTWVVKLQGDNKKTNTMSTFFNRLLDEVTKSILLIDPIHKESIYSLIRWIMMNFNELRNKDNMDLLNKRIRCREYISALLTIEFSNKLNRVVSMGNKATIDKYKDIFKFPGDIIFQQMHMSGILRFDDCINDLTFFRKFKVTFKGPHSQGNKNSNNVNNKIRGIHPSYLENFDVLVGGNSDQLGLAS